jgi:hypothetical protein
MLDVQLLIVLQRPTRMIISVMLKPTATEVRLRLDLASIPELLHYSFAGVKHYQHIVQVEVCPEPEPRQQSNPTHY